MFSTQKAEITLKSPFACWTRKCITMRKRGPTWKKIPHILRRTSHLHGALTTGFLPLAFPIKCFYAFFMSTRLARLIFLDFITFIISVEGSTNHEAPRCVFSPLSCYVVTPRLQEFLHHLVLSQSRSMSFPFVLTKDKR